jgi:hypothetical protein
LKFLAWKTVVMSLLVLPIMALACRAQTNPLILNSAERCHLRRKVVESPSAPSSVNRKVASANLASGNRRDKSRNKPWQLGTLEGAMC